MMKIQMKHVRKVISLVLIVTLVITGINLNMMSQSIYAAQKDKKGSEKAKEKVTVVKELTHERTENSNTYLLSNGSKKTDIYNENIRYEENGELVDYDTTLTKLDKTDKQQLNKILEDGTAKDYKVVNDKGDSKQYFPKELDENNGIVMSNGKYTLSLMPLSQEKEEKLVFTPEVQEDTITYTSETSDIQYQYTSLINGVKEDIILNSKPDTNEFAFKIDTKKFELELIEGYGGINLKDKKTGKNIGYIIPPNITDAEGNINYEDVKYTLEETREETILKLVVNKEYFENSNLVYPVKIDPTPVWFNDKLATAMVIDTLGNQNIHGETLTAANKAGATGFGYISEYRTYLDTSKIPAGDNFVNGSGDISGKYIENATLCITEVSGNYPTGTIEIRKPKSIWDTSEITWDTQPEIGDLIASFESTQVGGTRHNIDITEWAQGIASRTIEDTGLAFIAPQEGTGVMFMGPKVTHQNYMWLSITYCDMSVYDTTVEISGGFNEDSGKIEIKVEDFDQSNAEKTVTSYQVFERKGESDKFIRVTSNNEVTEAKKIGTDGIETTADFRVCVAYSDGTVMPSNIITFEKTNGTANGDYRQITVDTDGDGIEDGYEIWDFKTKWNGKDNNGNYILDSDGDGLTDTYEVFYQGSNPAVAEDFTEDSDGDGLSDIEEYHRGTDPHLTDSDFDGINDLNDYDTTNPRKTDNPDINGTDQSVAYTTSVYMGPYDKEYSETKDGVTYSYIKNIYGGEVKQVRYDYGDSSLNKTVKYFYDAQNYKTAVIVQCDEEYDSTHDQTICKTYVYNEDGNVIFVCDRKNSYSFTYNNGKISSIKIGDQEIVNYTDTLICDNTMNIASLEDGELVKSYEEVESYKNNGKIKTKLQYFKRAENDLTEEAFRKSFYYTDGISFSNECFRLQYDNQGELQKKYNCEQNITTTYSQNSGNVVEIRSDNFIKSSTSNEIENETTDVHTVSKSIEYTYMGCGGNTQTKFFTNIFNTNSDGSVRNEVDYNNERRSEKVVDGNERVTTEKFFNAISDSALIKDTKIINDLLSKTQTITYCKKNEDLIYSNINDEYTYEYDKAGNLVSVKLDNKTINEYVYDPHGRVVKEKEYLTKKEIRYIYDEAGNMCKKQTFNIDSSGNIVNSTPSEIIFTYNNDNFANQLTSYNEASIVYDVVGNPTNFYNGVTFEWTRGRLLSQVHLNSQLTAYYMYDEKGKRISKSLRHASSSDYSKTYYEWDGEKLIREYIINSAGNVTSDKWYIYDDNDEIVGCDYSYSSSTNNVTTKRIYYKKDINGSVIGLFDEDGVQFASYYYDAWGNIVQSSCKTGYESQFYTNNIKYKGCYMDSETSFYCLGDSYYVPTIGKSLSIDKPSDIVSSETNIQSFSIGGNTNLNYGQTKIPMQDAGYGVKYWINNEVGYCDTSDMWFEGMNMFNTNCYGFAINCWHYLDYDFDDKGYQNLYVGLSTGGEPFGNDFASCTEIAKYVKKDFESWGEDVEILTGSDNNPNYITDDDHLLIALRTMDSQNYSALGRFPEYHIDLYHFMVKKNGEWYFKSGYRNGFFKLNSNKSPETVKWSQYDLNTQNGRYEPLYVGVVENFYSSNTQYIVIPKTKLRIIG